MQLEATVALMTLGGPGSGRHPGSGHGEMQKAIKGLNKRGWLAHPTPTGYVLHHPNYPQNSIRTHISPSTGKMKWYSWEGRVSHNSGDTSHSLLEHVDRLTDRKETVKKQNAWQKAMPYLHRIAGDERARKFVEQALDPDSEFHDTSDFFLDFLPKQLGITARLGKHSKK